MKSYLPKLYCFLAALIILFIVPASGVQYSWNRTFGGTYGEGAWSLQETNDGGYIIAGYTCGLGERGDLLLVKTDSSGKEQWNRVFGGTDEDVGYFVRQTRDGGYIVTGSTGSYGIGEERLWLLKTDSSGNKEWDRTFGGFVSSSGDGGWCVDETDAGYDETDAGYILTGYTRSYGSGGKDLWLIKTDPLGIEQWQKAFGGSKDDVGMSVARALDGGYIVAGRAASFSQGDDDIWLLKVDSSGREQWNKTYGGQKDDVCFQVVCLEDGYALTGRTEVAGGKKAFLLKTDLQGKKKWERTYGKDSTGISLQRTHEGGFIIAGSTDTPGNGKDALLIKTDSAGKEQWTLPLGGPQDDIGTAIVESRDGGYALAGITGSNGSGAEKVWLVKLMADNIAGNITLGNIIPINATSINATSGNISTENTTLENSISQNSTSMAVPEIGSKNITDTRITANALNLDIPKLAIDRMPAKPPAFGSAKKGAD
ncbi:MAG: hypothetical protein ACE14P_05510 [Methanotrichaceae archaeon]